MRDFFNYLESIVDPKRNPKKRSYERMDDDDYVDPTLSDFDDDDDIGGGYRGQLGVTAQYPLASTSGRQRGYQIKTPQDALRGGSNVFKDRLRGRELFDTLRSKLASGEHMTTKEINYLLKLLNKEYEKHDAWSPRRR